MAEIEPEVLLHAVAVDKKSISSSGDVNERAAGKRCEGAASARGERRALKATGCLCVVCNTECWRSRVPPTWLVLCAVMVIQVRREGLGRYCCVAKICFSAPWL